MYQPYTTDTTPEGLRRARNAMRLRLWENDVFAHQWLCHPGERCEDGCEMEGDPAKVALYTSDLES